MVFLVILMCLAVLHPGTKLQRKVRSRVREGGTGGGFAETGTDPPIGGPPNRILTPPNSSHPPRLASGIPQTGDPVKLPPRDRFREIMTSGNELNELAKAGTTPQN